MIVPEVMKENLVRIGKDRNYTFDRPVPIGVVKPVETASSVLDLTGRRGRGYRSTYGAKARQIIDGGG